MCDKEMFGAKFDPYNDINILFSFYSFQRFFNWVLFHLISVTWSLFKYVIPKLASVWLWQLKH